MPKWEAFGWKVVSIDGHDVAGILGALEVAEGEKGRPTVIVANTVKGKGVSFAENNAAFHNASMTEEQYRLALAEIDGRIAEIGAAGTR
jgi:transketolase